jgi:hypothetical protein
MFNMCLQGSAEPPPSATYDLYAVSNHYGGEQGTVVGKRGARSSPGILQPPPRDSCLYISVHS